MEKSMPVTGQTMEKTKPKVRRLRVIQRLGPALEGFFEERFGRSGNSGNMEVKVVGDLILLRCKGVFSPAEVDLGSMKAGRLLVREVTERHCQELQRDLGMLLRRLTGCWLLDIFVGIFFSRREKIYLFTMSGRVKQ